MSVEPPRIREKTRSWFEKAEEEELDERPVRVWYQRQHGRVCCELLEQLGSIEAPVWRIRLPDGTVRKTTDRAFADEVGDERPKFAGGSRAPGSGRSCLRSFRPAS